MELLQEMQLRGLELDAISNTAAIRTCGKGGQWKQALEFLWKQDGQRKRALGLLQEMRQREFEPSVISYIAAICACEKGRRGIDLLQSPGVLAMAGLASHRSHRPGLEHGLSGAGTAVSPVLSDIS